MKLQFDSPAESEADVPTLCADVSVSATATGFGST